MGIVHDNRPIVNDKYPLSVAINANQALPKHGQPPTQEPLIHRLAGSAASL